MFFWVVRSFNIRHGILHSRVHVWEKIQKIHSCCWLAKESREREEIDDVHSSHIFCWTKERTERQEKLGKIDGSECMRGRAWRMKHRGRQVQHLSMVVKMKSRINQRKFYVEYLTWWRVSEWDSWDDWKGGIAEFHIISFMSLLWVSYETFFSMHRYRMPYVVELMTMTQQQMMKVDEIDRRMRFQTAEHAQWIQDSL